MNIKDVRVTDKLTIGEDCYYDHSKYTYGGVNEEGKHILTRNNSDGSVTKFIGTEPFVPELPLHLYFRNKRNGYLAELTGYTQMLGKMYYRLTIYEDVFKGYDLETLHELEKDWELLDENPFVDETKLVEQIDEYNSEIREYEKQIEEIKMKFINPIKKKREELYRYCKHDWYKYDEEEVSKGSFEQECVCNICGQEKTNRYSKLF